MKTMFVEKKMTVTVEVKAKTAAEARRIVEEMDMGPVQRNDSERVTNSVMKATWNTTKARWIARICDVCNQKQFTMRDKMCLMCRMKAWGE